MKYCYLTFDDGYRSNYDIVRPILKAFGFTGTFFVSGSFIATDKNPRTRFVEGYKSSANKEFMSWPEIVSMHSEGFEIGNHLLKHTHMTNKSHDRLLKYVQGLDAQFVKYGLPKSESLAYPGFLVNESSIEFCRRYGFRAARSGCGHTLQYDDFQFGGVGEGFDTNRDNALDVNCTFVFGRNYGLSDFRKDIVRFSESESVVLCFHDFAEKGLSVDILLEDFVSIIKYLSDNKYVSAKFKDIGSLKVLPEAGRGASEAKDLVHRI